MGLTQAHIQMANQADSWLGVLYETVVNGRFHKEAILYQNSLSHGPKKAWCADERIIIQGFLKALHQHLSKNEVPNIFINKN